MLMRKVLRMPEPSLMQTAEVAERLGVHPSTIGRWVDAGRLPAVRVGGSRGPLLFRPHDIERYERTQRMAAR